MWHILQKRVRRDRMSSIWIHGENGIDKFREWRTSCYQMSQHSKAVMLDPARGRLRRVSTWILSEGCNLAGWKVGLSQLGKLEEDDSLPWTGERKPLAKQTRSLLLSVQKYRKEMPGKRRVGETCLKRWKDNSMKLRLQQFHKVQEKYNHTPRN